MTKGIPGRYTSFAAAVTVRLAAVSAAAVLYCSCASEPQPPKPTLKAGFGETVITPQTNLPMRGFARSQVSEGVHDDLHARSVAFEGPDGSAAVMISLSLCTVGRDIVKSIRKPVTEATGIPAERIIVSCNHTHAGPSVEKGGEEFRRFLVERASESAITAWNSRFPAKVGSGSATLLDVGRNRRRLLYGGRHPDPEVLVLKVEDATGALRGVLFNYGCHPSTLDWRNRLISEDWPYYAIRDIKAGTADSVWVAFFQGAEGDINAGYSAELSAVGVPMPIRTFDYIEFMGSRMAETVLDLLPSIETDDVPLNVAQGISDYPLRSSFPVSLNEAERNAARTQSKLDALIRSGVDENSRSLDEVRAEVFITGLRQNTARAFYGEKDRPSATPIEQQAVRLGDTVFAAIPGEVFSEIGRRIKNESPAARTFLLGLANGYTGYMPTRNEYTEGAYEVDGSRYSADAEDACVAATTALIRKTGF